MQLSERMKMIADMLKACDVLADVGCDHAYITIDAVKSGRAKRACAMDVRQGPLDNAAANIKAAGLGGKISTVLSDGLNELPGTADEIMITGMGGGLTCSILERGREKLERCKRLIVSPHSDRAMVRKKIHELGFIIVSESDCIEDGKYYQCIAAEHGREKYEPEIFYEYGVFLLENRSENLIRYLRDKKEKSTAVERDFREKNGIVAKLPPEFMKQKSMIESALRFMGIGE